MGKTSSTRIPWENKKWKGGVVRRSFFEIFGSSFFLWILSFCFTGITIYLINPDHISRPWIYIVSLLLLPVITFFCYYFAFIAFLKAWSSSECEFRMETMPGVIGGQMRGQLILPKDLVINTKLYVQLTNTEDVSLIDDCPEGMPLGGVSDLYDHTTTIDAPDLMFIEKKCLITVEFTLPYDTKDETDSYDISDEWGTWVYKYRWFLHVYTDSQKKINLNIKFCVPIFRITESDPSIIGPAKSEDEREKNIEYPSTKKCITVLVRNGHKSYMTGTHLSEEDITASIIAFLSYVILSTLACLLLGWLLSSLLSQSGHSYISKLGWLFYTFCLFSGCCQRLQCLVDELEIIMCIKETRIVDETLRHRRIWKKGSGKTTFSYRIADQLLKQRKSAFGECWENKIPVNKIIRFVIYNLT